MFTTVYVELVKIFSKVRTYIGFIAIAVLVPIVIIAMKGEGMEYFEFATQALAQTFEIRGNLMNGYTVTWILLGLLYVHVPLLVTLVAGDVLAGEATAGTYRVLLTRPVSRWKVVTAKYLATMFSTVLLVLFLAVLSLGLGTLFLGTGEIVVLAKTVRIIPANDVLWRFVGAFCFAALSMVTVSSIAFMFSSFVENALGPIITTMAIIIVLTILSAIDVDFFNNIRTYFFTMKMDDWKLFFADPIEWGRITRSAAILFAHITVCYTVAVVVIQRKDILS